MNGLNQAIGSGRLVPMLLVAGCSLAMNGNPDDILSASDLADFANPPADARIRYGTDPLQFGDLRLPPGDGPHPVAVFLHGGCWLSEFDIAHSSALTDALAQNGIATWSLEYRRVGDEGGGWPGTFEDVARGADHLRSIAGGYRLDLGRVITAGHSAGGQLALWLAARAHAPPTGSPDAAAPLEVHGVLALAPAGDFDYLYEHETCDRAVARLMGGSPDEFPARYRQADPMRFPAAGTPQVIVVGSFDDTWTPPARNYFRMALARGDDVRLIEATESGHFEMIDPRSTTWPLVLAAARDLLGPARR